MAQPLWKGWDGDKTASNFAHSDNTNPKEFPFWYTFDLGQECQLCKYVHFGNPTANRIFDGGSLKSWEIYGRADKPVVGRSGIDIGEGKQIIISSDRSPDDLKVLEERLRTRFNMGLTANIAPPDFDLGMQIIQRKLKYYELAKPMDEEVLEFIANNFSTDVRKLEGALNRLFAYTTMINPPRVTLEIASEALKEQLNSFSYMKNDVKKIQNVVAKYYNITVDDMKSKKRLKKIAFPRQIAMYLSRELTSESLARIGLEFGGKDHTTIMHGIEKISKEMKKDSGLIEVINQLKEQLK